MCFSLTRSRKGVACRQRAVPTLALGFPCRLPALSPTCGGCVTERFFSFFFPFFTTQKSVSLYLHQFGSAGAVIALRARAPRPENTHWGGAHTHTPAVCTRVRKLVGSRCVATGGRKSCGRARRRQTETRHGCPDGPAQGCGLPLLLHTASVALYRAGQLPWEQQERSFQA